jgi:hypothetical protein
MASLTSRLAGWAAGRLKGEKARKKTMEFIDETGVGKLLSLAGDAAILGGAGKVAGAGARAIGAKLGIGGATPMASGDIAAKKGFLGFGKRPQMTPTFDPAGNITGYTPVVDPAASLARARSMTPPGMPISDAARNDALRAALDKANVGIEQNISRAVGQGPNVMAGKLAYTPIPGASATSRLTADAMTRLAGMGPQSPINTEAIGRFVSRAPDIGNVGAIPNVPGMDLGRMARDVNFRGIGDMVQRGAADYIGQPRTMAERLAGAAGRVGGAVRGVGSYLARKPEVAGQALTAYTTARQGAANRQIQREQLAQRESEFEREYGLRKGQDERELERQRRIAQMLAPLFQRISGGQG